MPTNTVLDLTKVKPDFYDLVSALQGELKNRDSWVDVYPGATGQTLIEFMSAIGMFNQWSIEKALREAFLHTANRSSSIYSIARMLGVRIARKLPGIHTATMTRTNVSGFPITTALSIAPYSQFFVDGVPYFNRSSFMFQTASDTIDGVFLHQGTVYQKEYISDGTAFQQFIIPSLSPMSVSDADVYVLVDGEPWEIIQDGLWHYDATSKVVSDETLGNGDVMLQFGNGYNGVIPQINAKITVLYAETLGAKTNLIPAGSRVTAASQFDNQILKGVVTKENIVNNINNTLANLPLNISSVTSAIPTASLPVGNYWSQNHIGLQLEDGKGGLALVTTIHQNVAKLAIVNSFRSNNMAPGTWSLTTPSVGADEKPASYYKIIAPYLFRSNGRAITVDDHYALCLSYPGVSDVLIKTERDLLETYRIWINPYPGMPEINFISEQSLADNTSLSTSDFGRNFILMNSASDYNIALPSALGNEGMFIGFIADAHLQRRVNIDSGIGAVETLDHFVVISDGVRWNKIRYVETQRSSHPELMNVIWVTILTESGIQWSSADWADFLSWFSQFQLAGTMIKPQNPNKELVNITMRVMCRQNANLGDIEYQARNIVTDIFAPNKPMINKRISLSDITAALKSSISDIDYVEILSPTKDMVPTPTTIHPVTGAPSAPNYLALNQLIVNVDYTDRS